MSHDYSYLFSTKQLGASPSYLSFSGESIVPLSCFSLSSIKCQNINNLNATYRNTPLEPELVERDEPAPHFRTFEPKPPTRDGIPEPKQLS